MNRDGKNESLWQVGTPDFDSRNEIPLRDELYDVVIAGGGITGITTGLLLKKAGKSVLIAEAHSLGFGTTGGTTAHLNSFLETPYNDIIHKFGEKNAQLVAKASRQALDLIKKHVAEYKIDC